MTAKLRHILLTAALLGSAGLVLFSDPPQAKSDIVEPAKQPPQDTSINTVSPTQQQVTSQTSATGTQLLTRASRDYDIYSESGTRHSQTTPDLFAAHNWAPPALSRQESGSLFSEQTAPALPFTMIGKHQIDGKWEIFLASGQNDYVVHEQDIINEQYKIESIRPPVMTLIYLPLNTRQTMQIGDFE